MQGRKGTQSIKKWEAQRVKTTRLLYLVSVVGGWACVCGAVRNKRGQRGSTAMERCKILNARRRQDKEHEGVEEVKEGKQKWSPNNTDGRSRGAAVPSMGSI